MIRDWVWDSLASLAYGLALLTVIFVPLERGFWARRQRVFRPEFVTDLAFLAGQYLVFSAAITAVLQVLHTRAHAVEALASLHARVAALPIVVQAIAAVVLGDLVVYWFHRACRRFDFLWRFHAVHHSVEHLDWLAAHREHPLDGLITQLCINLPGILIGIRFDVLGPLVLFRGVWAIFIHANVRLPVGPFKYLFGAPELHRWHPARVPTTRHNFANLAPYLDVLFGTYHCPDDAREPYALGLVDPWPRRYLAQLVRPFGVGSLSTMRRE